MRTKIYLDARACFQADPDMGRFFIESPLSDNGGSAQAWTLEIGTTLDPKLAVRQLDRLIRALVAHRNGIAEGAKVAAVRLK